MSKKLFAIMIVALCTLGLTGYAMGQNLLLNAGFETWTAGPGGPPDSWTLITGSFTATQEGTIVNSGTYSCNLTWTSTSNQDFGQTVAVTAGQTYEFTFWAYDNDPLGRVRVCVRWKDSGGGTISTYYGGYTSDGTSWQQLSSGEQTAPAGAVSAIAMIRCYDVSTSGQGTVYVDDASFQEAAPPPPPDTLTIPEIQYNETTETPGCYPSPEDGNVVVTSGIVTAVLSGDYPNFWIEEPDNGLWSGVFVYEAAIDPSRGDSITITAEVDEYYGLTEMKNVSEFTIHSSGNPEPTALVITPGDLADSCDAHSESFEGVLCCLQNVFCTQEASGYGEWYVSDGTDTCQIDDFIYHYEPFLGETFEGITGIVHYSYDSYELNPRDANDIGPPCYVELASFEAAAGDGQVTITWRTAAEVGSHSFNIYRDDEVIASVPAFGDAHDYIYVDRQVTNGAAYTYQLSDIDLDGSETMHPMFCSVTPNAVPVSYALNQNYPNPFNPSTEISYALPEKAHVTLKVYNLLGQEMVTLVDDTKSAGRHTISWNAAGNASGVYFYRLQTDDFSATKKMVFLK